MTNVKSKTAELSSLIRRYEGLTLVNATRDHVLTDTNPLSMALNSAVDTGLAGGIPLYRRAFFDSSFVAANTDKIGLIEGLRSAIDDQVRTSKATLSSSGKILPLLTRCGSRKLSSASPETVPSRHGHLPFNLSQM